jgi:hypothetical protein
VPITSDTPTNLIIGAGEYYLDNASVGATTDDNEYRIERELFTPELNGAKGALVGTDYITRSEGVLAVSVPEFNATILLAMWPGSTATGGDPNTIDEDNTRRIPTTDYHDHELQIERLGGGEFQFEVDDALHTGNLEATLGDDSLTAPRIEARSRWDPADLTASPHRIRVMNVIS